MSWKRVIYVIFIIIVAGISALSGALAGGLAVYSAISSPVSSISQPTNTQVTLTEQQPATIINEVETSITEAVEKVGPAVVTVIGVVPGQVTFFGRTPDSPVSGSGVFISPDGYILTNHHVIEDTLEVAVVLADGTEIPAEVIGSDSFTDIAILKTDGPIPAVAELGNSDALKPGETVIAIVSPLGDFKNTVTAGVVSATERAIDIDQNYQMQGLIQTDAAINQGNSGGPLVNLAGEVIGINTLIVRGGGYGSAIAEGLGFAIPINTAQAVADQIIEKGYLSYPYLGIRYQWITPAISNRYDLPVESGVYVSYIEPESPADQAGLEPGDIITHIGDMPLDEDHPFTNVLYSYDPGETTTITVARGENILELQTTFAERPVP
jgi:serine protease Do